MADLLMEQVNNYKREILIDALKETGGNLSAVARKFQRKPASVFNTLRALGINAADYKPKYKKYFSAD